MHLSHWKHSNSNNCNWLYSGIYIKCSFFFFFLNIKSPKNRFYYAMDNMIILIGLTGFQLKQLFQQGTRLASTNQYVYIIYIIIFPRPFYKHKTRLTTHTILCAKITYCIAWHFPLIALHVYRSILINLLSLVNMHTFLITLVDA